MAIKNIKKRRLSFGAAKEPSEVKEINGLEEKIKQLSDEKLREESLALQKRAKKEENLDNLLPRAFALVRETARRTLGQRHFDVQLWGGVVMHNGNIAEMLTGEGKTLASTAPIYFNALTGKGVHVITVNDYLAKRDTVWMGQIYHALGLTVSCLVHDNALIYDPDWKATEEAFREKIDKERDTTGSFQIQEDFLRPATRKEAYNTDITYGTNHEFGFDYLRDNLKNDVREQVQRKLNFAVIDEVDSILIDEARTPLIISTPDKGAADYYRIFAQAASRLTPEEDYIADEKLKAVEITEPGIDKVEKITGIEDLYAVENLRLVHYLEASLRARALFERDREYVVKDGEVIIVDQFTGRLMYGRRYSAGLHQAIEAKEGVHVREESKTFAQISIQNYFRLYEKLAGMTGTAQTSAEEFHKVYGMEVVSIPTNKPLVRDDMGDVVYRTLGAKYKAIANDVKERHEKGQPVLLGTVSIDKNELLSNYLKKAGVPHEVLNAKNNEREGGVIAQAGRSGAVTVATNMAGRGVDIVLGGNPPDKKRSEQIKEAGGLHVIGTERHEARRIDNQLRGRSGRQGDVGSSQFFLSLEDDLLRIFSGDKMKSLMERFDLPEDHPIENKMVSKAIEGAQTKVEGFHFDARKHLLEYDDVLNKQRLVFYKKRQEIVEASSFAAPDIKAAEDSKKPRVKVRDPEKIRSILRTSILGYFERLKEANIPEEDLKKIFAGAGITENDAKDIESAEKFAEEKLKSHSDELIGAIGRQLLVILNVLWMNHLEDIEAITESVRIRAYGQRDPLVEYRKETKTFFDRIEVHFDEWVFNNILKIRQLTEEEVRQRQQAVITKDPKFKKIGRNDPCPCGAINPNTDKPYKFKKCGMVGAPHHKGQ